MTARCIPVLVALLSLALGPACKKPAPAPVPPPVKVDDGPITLADTSDDIVEGWLTMQPTTATGLGDHRFDTRWPDLSADGLAADRKRIDDALATLDALDVARLGTDDRIDHEILRTELLRQRFTHEIERPWARDPMWYAGIVGSGLEDLVSRDFAPITERAQSVAGRLEGLPAFVDLAIANLQAGATMGPQTQVAVGQLAGIAQLVSEVIPARVAGARPADRDRVTAATGPAAEAVAKFAAHVETQLLPQANAPWRLGAADYERKLQLTLQADISAEELRRLAVLEHTRVRQSMVAVADRLGVELLGKRKMERVRSRSTGDGDAAVVKAVLDELGEQHVAPPHLRDRIEANLARLTAFVKQAGLVSMDDAEKLDVIWTPPHQRGVFVAGLAPPGPLEPQGTGLPSFYLVQPVPDDWPHDVRESFLREYNDFMIEILSIHEAIPGHFVQLYFAKREPSKIRRILANGAFVEGWAVYAERIMVEAGYNGETPSGDRPSGTSRAVWKVMQDPELRKLAIELHALKFYLRTVTNAILDHGVHAGEMTELDALELLVDRSFQQEGEARAKWIRAQVTSTQLSTYFVGAQAWLRLRERAEARAVEKGETFDARAFHDAALSHGAPPVPQLVELLWPGDSAAAPAPKPKPAPATPPTPTPPATP